MVENAQFATMYNNLGYVYQKLSNFPKAIKMFTDALHIWNSVYPAGDAVIATCTG